jgi:cell division septum initiation protein DivIVA
VDEGEVDVLALLDELEDVFSSAKGVPLSDQLRVAPDEVNALLDGIRASLPGAVKEARQVVKQRETIISETNRDCQRLLDAAREDAVQEASPGALVRIAERHADKIVASARRSAHEQQLEFDEWAEAILVSLDRNFERLLVAARRGRDRIAERASAESSIDAAAEDEPTAPTIEGPGPTPPSG